MEVLYLINSLPFKDFGIYVSDSLGIADGLKRKKINSYDWAENNGLALDLSNPKYEERTIILKCFIVGSNWDVMSENFQSFMAQYQKPGTQRLLIEPAGMKSRPYEVFCYDDVALSKTFRKGQMIGVFSIKLVEPNPIKKVFYTLAESVDISFEADGETQIFWGNGTVSNVRGMVNINTDYSLPSFDTTGYSLIYQSIANPNYFQTDISQSKNIQYLFSVEIIGQPNAKLFVIGRNKTTNTYEVVAEGSSTPSIKSKLSAVAKANIANYGKLFYKVLVDNQEIAGLELTNPKLEKIVANGEWRDMTGKLKLIVIAGNVKEIEVTTNAKLLWTEL